MKPAALIAELRSRAEALGFDAFGIARADARPDLPGKLRAALERGWHGDMDWMEETAGRRGAPGQLWDRAKIAGEPPVSRTPDGRRWTAPPWEPPSELPRCQ